MNTWYAGLPAVLGKLSAGKCGGSVSAVDANGNVVGILGATGICMNPMPPKT